jgi:hypothetical protein
MTLRNRALLLFPYCPVNRESVPEDDVSVGSANQNYEHTISERHFALSASRSLKQATSGSALRLSEDIAQELVQRSADPGDDLGEATQRFVGPPRGKSQNGF